MLMNQLLALPELLGSGHDRGMHEQGPFKVSLLVSTVLAVLALGAPSKATAGANEIEPSRSEFYEELSKVEELIEREKWSSVQSSILNLLRRHSGETYVIPHLSSLRRMFADAQFDETYERRPPQTVTYGNVLEYSPKNHAIKIRYERATLNEFREVSFDSVRGGFVHPIEFTGPWTVTIEGLPRIISDWRYAIEFGDVFERTVRSGLQVEFGSRAEGRKRYTKHQLFRVDGHKKEPIARAIPKSREDPDQPVVAKLIVSKDRIVARYDGKKVVSSRIEFSGTPRFTLVPTVGLERARLASVTLSGPTAGAWIESKIDAREAEDRDLFHERWQAPDAFSSWGTSEGQFTRSLTLDDLRKLPVFEPSFENEEQEAKYRDLLRSMGMGFRSAAKARHRIPDALKQGMPASATEILMFESLLANAVYESAFVWGTIMTPRPYLRREHTTLLCEVLSREERPDLALRMATKALPLYPGEPSLLYQQGLGLMRKGRIEDALWVARNALEDWPWETRLAALEHTCRKSIHGPAWPQRHEHRGEHFVVCTDISAPLAATVAQILDRAWRRCGTFFGQLEMPNPHRDEETVLYTPRVYVFGDRSSYERFTAHALMKPSRLPNVLYDPKSQIFAVLDTGNRKALADSLRRGAVHRYLHEAVHDSVPMWIREGTSEVFVSCWFSDTKFTPPPDIPAYLDYLANRKPLPDLAEFVTSTDEEYFANEEHYLRFSWLVVMVLGITTDDRVPPLIESLIAMASGEPNTDALVAFINPTSGRYTKKALNNFVTLKRAERRRKAKK